MVYRIFRNGLYQSRWSVNKVLFKESYFTVECEFNDELNLILGDSLTIVLQSCENPLTPFNPLKNGICFNGVVKGCANIENCVATIILAVI